MERNYPASGFGDLGTGTGWSYARSAKASLVYGSRSYHPESELLHRQTYGTPNPLQCYAGSHHPGSSRQGGTWGGCTLDLSGLFESSLHHASPSGADPSVMNLISALDSQPPQPSPSASSLLSQFRTSSWQTAMHTPAPTDLFISGALPGSSSFHSSSALSAYQNPSIFSGRSFTPSLSLQDTTTFSQTSNGLISPHDPLVHIKRSSQSSLGFDHLLSSQSTAFKGSQESATPQTQDPSTSSNCHLSPPQFNLLPSQLHNSSSQPYNASMLSSTAALPPAILPEPQPLQQTAISRHNSVIKHYPLSSSAYTTTLQSQSYASSDGSSGYHQLVSHYQHAGVSYSPLGERSLSSDPKTSPRMESQIYQPVIQTAYTSSLSTSSTPSSSTATTKGAKSSCSTSNYSSSSCTPQTPPSTSSTSSSSSSSSKTSTISLSAPSLQQPAPQSALVPPLLPVVSSSLVQQAAANQCLSTYGSQSVTKPSTSLPNHTPPQQHIQSYSLNLPPSTHMTVHYDGFNSPHVRDLSTGARSSGGKDFMGVGSGERSFSAEIIIQDSSFVSTSLRKPQSPSIDYGSGSAGSGPGIHSVLGSAGTGNGAAGNEGSNAYHLTESSTSPSTNSTISYSGLHSPVAARPVQSPGGSGANKYLSSIPAPTFMSSPQGFPDKRQARNQLYHSSPPNTKTEATNMLGAEESQDEGDSEDFLIHHLLHPQSSNPHFSQHHPHSEQLSQPILHGESKGMTYDLNKISEERYQLQSVIRTNNITSNSGLGMAINDTVSLDRPLEISQKKQQARSDSIISKSNASGVRRISDSHSHAIHSHHQQNELMGSAVYYGRGDPYIQHPNSQHHHSTSHHSQHIHRNSLPQSHSLIEIKKPSDANDNAYYPPDVQQTRQSHVSVSLMNTSPDHPKQTHMLQSVPSHTIQNKLDSQQAPQQQQKHQQQQQQHQQAMMGSVRRAGSAGLESHVQNRSSQMQLQLQTQRLDTHYSGSHPTYQTGASQSSVSPLQMLDQSLSQANGTDSGRSLDRSGADMNSHFLSEQDLDLYTPSHLSHLNQPQTHPHTHALQHTQHTHHQLSVTTQITNSHLQQMTIHLATPQQQQSQATDPETQLSHSQLEQLKQHQFETVSQTDKVGQTQAQLQQCAPLTSICFPDCVFLEMEDMFCSSEYKSGYTGARHSAQENLSRGHGPIQEDMEALKSGGAAEGYNMVGHHSNQGFGQYCQGLCQGNGDLHLDHDCLKTHELPSTVITDQLGLIQSQTPIMGLNSAVQGDSLVNKMIATVGVGGNSNSTGVTSPIFCSSRPKKLLRTSSFHLLKQRREPQPQTKKNYAQEYEFGDDEDKADVPADIRLNNRRLPDLLPDLVSSCRKPGGVSGISGLSPQTGDMDFCHPSSYSSLGHDSQHPPNDGPKKRGRKPTKPKREGPPRPRGRPRIRPLPEPPYCRGLMGSVAGENRRGRGRGRARCRREEGKQPQQHHHHHQQEHISCPHPQLHHQQQQHTSHQSQQDPIKLHLATMSPPESLLRTDSLSSSNPVPSEGSVGSAPSLGLSPGPSTTVDYNRNEIDKKVFDFKPSFMASFLDFLKTGKKQPDLEPRHDGGNQETCSSMRGGIKCLSSPSPPLPPTSPQQPPGPFSDGSQGEGPDLALSSCQSSCKPLDDELKRNLGTLPSFSSDEEDSVSKNQDLQKSISSAISALYDTPHSLAAAVASAVVKVQPMLSPPTPQEPSLSPPLKTMSPLIPSMESIKDGALAHTQHNTQNKQNTREEQKMISILSDMEWVGSEHGKEEENSSNCSLLPTPVHLPTSHPIVTPFQPSLRPIDPPPSTTPPPSSSDQDQEPEAGLPYFFSTLSSSPSSLSSHPPSPPTPEEAPQSQRLTSLHLAKKQADAAIAGESEEEDSESGGEGIFRERDEFVVRTEDIGTLKMALQTGREPPPIWRVQKALLQKFSPEIKDGQRQFCATSNYLGYFGDAKVYYQRLYVKFLENVNKKDYVRVCSRKPWHRAGLILRRQPLPKQLLTIHNQSQPRIDSRHKERRNERELMEQRERERRERETRKKERSLREQRDTDRQEREWGERHRGQKDREQREMETDSEQKEKEKAQEKEKKKNMEQVNRDYTMALKEEKNRGDIKIAFQGRANTSKDKAEPPPKKRKKWLKAVLSSSSESDYFLLSDDEGQLFFVCIILNSRAMRDMFRSYVEMLVSTALDPDMIQALEDTDDELYLPPMRKIDSMLSEQKKKLLRRVNMSAQHQEVLHIFPRMTADPVESGDVKVHLGGEGYNRKTLNQVKRSIPKQQDMKLSIEICQIYSLYHSLHHYKYHTFLHCKKETDNIEQAAEDPGQEEVVQQCMANQGWLESLFSSFMELLTLSAKT
uniref:Proline rich 12b n=1 Tax=Oreochromis niloticus TaxID=8128 RepID=I3JLS1_ORENI